MYRYIHMDVDMNGIVHLINISAVDKKIKMWNLVFFLEDQVDFSS